MTNPSGKVVQVNGSVIDVQFPAGDLPEILEGLEIVQDDGEILVLEVEKMMENYIARCVAMNTTDGLSRGLPDRKSVV